MGRDEERERRRVGIGVEGLARSDSREGGGTDTGGEAEEVEVE